MSHFANAPFSIEALIPRTAKTCPPPGASSSVGFKDGTGDPGGCTRDLVNRFYQSQYQLNHGLQNHYTTGSDAVGLTQAYYDTTALPIYEYLHSKGHPATRSPTTSSRRRSAGRPQPPVADRARHRAGPPRCTRSWTRTACRSATRSTTRPGRSVTNPVRVPARRGNGRPESGACVRRLRDQHGPASVQPFRGSPQLPPQTGTTIGDELTRPASAGPGTQRWSNANGDYLGAGLDERAGCWRVGDPN